MGGVVSGQLGTLIVGALLLAGSVAAVECPPGFAFHRMSGVGCVQEDCNDRPHAHWSYVKACICAAHDNIDDPEEDKYSKACTAPVDYESFDREKCGIHCPGSILTKCILPTELCPGETTTTSTIVTTSIVYDSPEEEECDKQYRRESEPHLIGFINANGECVGGCELGWEMSAEGCISCDKVCEGEPGTAYSPEDSDVNDCECVTTPEAEEQYIERTINQNLADYLAQKNAILGDMDGLMRRADLIMQALREAEWLAAHGTDEEKEQAKKDIEKLKGEQAELMAEFEERTDKLYEILDNLHSLFPEYKNRDAYERYLGVLKGELDMTKLNLALRAGDRKTFDETLRAVRQSPAYESQALTANAFRQLMDGDTRTALASARKALEDDPDNPIAQHLIEKIELAYLQRIRDKIAGEQSQTSKLFNDKLNKHGEAGLGSLLIDIATTGVGESFSAITGYYDVLGDLQDVQIDEASRQVAGIRLIEDLRGRGVSFEQMNNLDVAAVKALIKEHYGKDLSDDEAKKLRQRIYDGYRNLDVNAIRNGDPTQYDIDVGRDYFDTDVLEFNEADLLNRQFSAWDTFLTFAPSAQLGRLGNTGLAAELGLTSTSTVQQGLQGVLRIERLGQSIYQTREGAAVIDGLYKLNGYQKMVADTIKEYVGETAYAAGSAAISTALNELTAPQKKKLQEELTKMSDHFLGADATAGIQATAASMQSIFNFVGLNQQAIMRGAFGVQQREQMSNRIRGELNRESNVLNNRGVTQASGGTRNFQEFQQQVSKNPGMLDDIDDAQRTIAGFTQENIPRRRNLLAQADATLSAQRRAAQLLQQGDTRGAQRAFNEFRAAQDGLNQLRGHTQRRMGTLNTLMNQYADLANSPPDDKAVLAAVQGYLSSNVAASDPQQGDDVKRTQQLLGVISAGLSENIPK